MVAVLPCVSVHPRGKSAEKFFFAGWYLQQAAWFSPPPGDPHGAPVYVLPGSNAVPEKEFETARAWPESETVPGCELRRPAYPYSSNDSRQRYNWPRLKCAPIRALLLAPRSLSAALWPMLAQSESGWLRLRQRKRRPG